jgi:transposase InsO family protein
MHVQMQNAEALTPEQISQFLQGSSGVEFAGQKRQEVYAWIERTLVAQEYHKQRKKRRGLIRAYLAKATGLSLPQITRLIRRYAATGKVEGQPCRKHRFPVKYTEADVRLLAEVDRAHERLSGPATRRILQREYEQFGKQEYGRLAGISVAHLYNLRQSAGYRKHAAVFEATRPSRVAIGERRRPDPQGRPGYLRVDTVHQGDWDGAKGVYHINAVDTVTQWQVVGCASKISEQYLIPVLEAMLHQFPFRILGFHADNGSEYVNHRVAKLLEKLLIEFTKSRPNRSQDNALVEGKNGAIIRKHMGYGHIASAHAEALQKFYTAHLNPYLNVWVCDGRVGRARQAQTALPGQGLCDALRKAEGAARSSAPSQGGDRFGAVGHASGRDERYRVRPESDGREGQAAGAREERIADTAAIFVKPAAGGRGNGGAVESAENRRQVFRPSHRPLEISPKSRDFHIPTARRAPRGKVENHKADFPLFHAGLATTVPVCLSQPRNQERRSAATRPSRADFQDHSVLETGPDFRIILGLENATALRRRYEIVPSDCTRTPGGTSLCATKNKFGAAASAIWRRK